MNARLLLVGRARALGVTALLLSGCLALEGHSGWWSCTSDADCSGGNTCRALRESAGRVCAPPDYCGVSADCSFSANDFGWSCEGNRCSPPRCASNAECRPFACRDAVCLNRCESNDDCMGGFDCSKGVCIIHRCASDAECGAYRCEQGVCATSCASEGTCSAGNLCNHGTCGPRSCTPGVPGGCDGYLCEGGACASRCSSTADCDRGLACVSGTCTCDPGSSGCDAYACRGRACLTSCSTSSDCAAGRSCLSSKCVVCTGTAVACADQPSCSAAGCSRSAVCTGGTFACTAFPPPSCGGMVGCSSSYGECRGMARCADQSAGSCPTKSFFGCSLSDACGGTPTPCSTLTPSQCTMTAGCTLQ